MGVQHTKFERIPITCTPTSKQNNSYNGTQTKPSVDPRSPSVGVKRTPVSRRRLHKSTSIASLTTTPFDPNALDPRSPSQARTPITKTPFSNQDPCENNTSPIHTTSTNTFLDPRSPTSQIARTPIPFNASHNNNNSQDDLMSPSSVKEPVLNGAEEERKVVIDNTIHQTTVQQPMDIASPRVVLRSKSKTQTIASPIRKRRASNANSNTLPRDFKKTVHNHNQNIENTPPNPRLQRKLSTPNTPRTPLSHK
eukprot:TRINITY_DN3250_c0_g1_i1.p1 TRINITY_DN3250_c0_g1~~TRINITY_DN3250_c0_g1_i1.p1  ORF type:complete len:252 (-),score=53.01 TRINITY_DN3250_c0_g1_i1:19-774(-)